MHVEAPAGCAPAAIVELVVMALAARPRRRSRRLVMLLIVTVGALRTGVRKDARRRAARRRGVTVADAPRLVVPPCSTTLIECLGLRMWPWLRNREPPMPSWPFWLAVGIIREFLERRSWRQAWRHVDRAPGLERLDRRPQTTAAAA